MTTSPRLGYAELEAGETVPEDAVNNIGRYIESGAGMFNCVSIGTTAPPGSPSNGAMYILGASATGDWSGYASGSKALYIVDHWVNIVSREGDFAYSQAADKLYVNNGTGDVAAWVEYTAAVAAPSIQAVTSSVTVTPTFSDDQVNITAQATGLTLANPTGTAVPARGLSIRIKDNGGSQTISYGTQYRAIGVSLPASTTASKTLYLGLIFNNTDTKWDVVAVAQEA